MTDWRLGPIGRRVLAAFLVVALTSVGVLVIATAIGVDLGRSSATRVERQHMAEDLATVAGLAYAEEQRWTGSGLAEVQARAEEAQAHFIVVAHDGAVVYGGPVGQGFRAKAFTAPVLADGQQVGTAHLAFRDDARPAAPDVSNDWLLTATVAAMVAALAMAALLTRRLTRPLDALTTTARAFAAGDREARATTDAPGELGELARSFNDLVDEVTRSEQARRHLSADVAHELRTPLTALQGGLEEVMLGGRPPDRATMAALHEQALRLGRVVADLAELSQAEADGLRLEPQDVELADLVRSGLSAWEAAARGAGQRIVPELEDGVWVRADPDRLGQVVGNLVSNAARYARRGGTVALGVRSVGSDAVLTVSDDGPGIPPEEVPHVFDRFWRGSSTGAGAGSGLGLAIARALVEASGGRIELASEVGAGTVVTVRLPLAD